MTAGRDRRRDARPTDEEVPDVDFDRLTHKSQEALQRAAGLARDR